MSDEDKDFGIGAIIGIGLLIFGIGVIALCSFVLGPLGFCLGFIGVGAATVYAGIQLRNGRRTDGNRLEEVGE